MKSFHYLILLPLFLCGALALMSCGSNESITGIKDGDAAWGYGRAVRNFEYEGHSYITFVFNRGGSGTVHDPDCPCSKGHNPEVEK